MRIILSQAEKIYGQFTHKMLLECEQNEQQQQQEQQPQQQRP